MDQQHPDMGQIPLVIESLPDFQLSINLAHNEQAPVATKGKICVRASSTHQNVPQSRAKLHVNMLGNKVVQKKQIA